MSPSPLLTIICLWVVVGGTHAYYPNKTGSERSNLVQILCKECKHNDATLQRLEISSMFSSSGRGDSDSRMGEHYSHHFDCLWVSDHLRLSEFLTSPFTYWDLFLQNSERSRQKVYMWAHWLLCCWSYRHLWAPDVKELNSSPRDWAESAFNTEPSLQPSFLFFLKQ